MQSEIECESRLTGMKTLTKVAAQKVAECINSIQSVFLDGS